MQDLIFYVAANETLGAVRDYANLRNENAPTLVLGVSVCLRMRLFTERNVATAYPVSAFSGIASWNWSMDGDYDRSTTCKLTADAGSITVHSVTDTVNGESMTFTEFVIPISSMNTLELATWLGTAESKSGLAGELVGYDGSGNAVFVLQIENFTVRNRITGTGEPTSQSQDLITRAEAQNLIQYAISGATVNVENVVSAASAGYATNAGVAVVASSLPEAVYSGITSSIINTAKADIQSGGTAYYASSASTAGEASGLTSAAKSSIIAEAIAAGAGASGGTVVVSGGTATTSSFGTVKVNTSVTASDTGTDADATVPTVNAMIAYVGSQTPSFVQQAGYAVNAGFATKAGEAPYTGPFAVGVTSAGITVAGGRMYLGGAEYAVGSTTLTSSNGTVYFYVYYSSGSYYSGCSVAASASALATVIRGSQGYFTALANVSGGVVTQCHYGDIRIDGRVV